MLSKKAQDVVILDLHKLSSAADYFVVCSADSDTQVKAIADAVQDGTEEFGERSWHSEGYQSLHWVIVDYVDVVAHVFYKEDRAFYNLERLWGHAKRKKITDTDEAPVKKKRTPSKKPAAPKKRIAKKKVTE